MKTSDKIDAISAALSLAQGEFPFIEKLRDNPYFKSKYADLSDILAACKPILLKHGLALTQGLAFADSRLIITTCLIHKSGQWLSSELSIKPDKDTAQALGSAATYGRRYSAEAILGVSASIDDDGNEATRGKKEVVEHIVARDLNKVYTGTSEDKKFLFAIMERHGVSDTHLMANINVRCVGKTLGSLEKVVVEMAG